MPRGRDPDAAERIMSALATAKRPLLYFGNGCRSALIGPRRMTGEARAEVEHRRARFQNLTTTFALAVTTTPNAKGVFPETHPLSLRNYGFGGSNWSVNYLTADARSAAGSALPYDALLVLGSSLTEKSTNSWDPVLIPDGPILQVDLNQGVIGRGFPIAAGVVAEIGGFIDDLIEAGAPMAVGKLPMEVGVITAMAGLIRSHRIRSPSYLGRGFLFGDRLWPREGSAQPVVLMAFSLISASAHRH